MMPRDTTTPIDIDSAAMATLFFGLASLGGVGSRLPRGGASMPREKEKEPRGPSRSLRRTARMSKKERRKVGE